MDTSAPRYAVYFAPDPASALWRFGCSVVGRDAADGPGAAAGGLRAALEARWPDWAASTAEPRKYGFHATLMAPFRLRAGLGEADLIAGAARFCAGRGGCAAAGLAVAPLADFVALVPVGDTAELQALAADVVTAFDACRAPLDDAGRARRLASPLTPRQRGYLETYGYPYVHEEFRFHMTLCGPLPPGRTHAVATELAAQFAARVPAGPVRIDRLAVFKQDTPAAPFRIVARSHLA
jgi:putative phosphonate metabolism protein